MPVMAQAGIAPTSWHALVGRQRRRLTLHPPIYPVRAHNGQPRIRRGREKEHDDE